MKQLQHTQKPLELPFWKTLLYSIPACVFVIVFWLLFFVLRGLYFTLPKQFHKIKYAERDYYTSLDLSWRYFVITPEQEAAIHEALRDLEGLREVSEEELEELKARSENYVHFIPKVTLYEYGLLREISLFFNRTRYYYTADNVFEIFERIRYILETYPPMPFPQKVF